MGRYLQPGHEYSDGQTITGPSLTEHVADAVLKTTAISEQLLKDNAAATDELLINDSGVFKKITLQILKTLIAETLTSEELSDELRNELKTPIGAILDFAGTSEPDGWLFCYGQDVSRTTYDLLYQQIGNTYGAGDGSSTFTLPDCRGRVAAGKDDMGGTSSDRLSAILNGDALGAAGGTERHTMSVAEMPAHAHSFTDFYKDLIAGGTLPFGGVLMMGNASIASGTTNTGGSQPHSSLQPTIIFNKIIRAL